MTKFVRWLRGAMGIGITWAVLWVVFGLLLGLVIRIFQPEDIGSGEGMSQIVPILALLGLLCGLGFAGLLSLAERKRTLRELSFGRVALWGMLGSAAIPLLMGTDGSMAWLTGSLGAVFASASVAIARGGEWRDAGSSRNEAPDLLSQ